MPATKTPRTPTIRSTVNVLPQAASSYSMDGVLATSLNFDVDAKEEEAFHKSNRCRMMTQCSPVKKCWDPMWQMPKWLQAFEEGLGRKEISWWPLLLLLTDEANAAIKEFVKWLLAMW